MRAFHMLLIAAYAFLLCTEDAAAGSNLRFHASFDRDTAADVSQGKAQPALNAGLRLTEGRIGKAVVLDARSRLAFETAGHISPGSGQ